MSVCFKKNKTHFLNILFLVTFAFSTTATAELVKRAAVVETVNGLPQSVFYVSREGKKLEVFPTKVLQDGDWLWITQPNNHFLKEKQNFVTLTFGGSHSEKVTYYDSPYLIKKRDTAPSIPENVIAETETWFSSLFKHYLKSVIAIVRTDEASSLSMPLLTKHQAKMVAGKRKLHLAWQGGNAPYRVQVLYHGYASNPFFVKTGIHSKRMQFEKRLWNPGRYLIVLSDAEGLIIKGILQVVGSLSSTLIQTEQKMKKSTMPEWAKQTLFAAWLGQQEQGAWTFEAYQYVAEIAKKYQPASLVKIELENN